MFNSHALQSHKVLPRSSVLVLQLKVNLDSPEAIAKWVEERRKRWPSTRRIEEKVRVFVHPCVLNDI